MKEIIKAISFRVIVLRTIVIQMLKISISALDGTFREVIFPTNYFIAFLMPAVPIRFLQIGRRFRTNHEKNGEHFRIF